VNTIAPRDSRQYHGENQHPGKLPHPEVGCPLALDADDGAKPHALARDVRRVASIDLRVRAQASRVRPLGRPTQCVACPAPRTARYGSTARGRGGAGGCHCADILVALRCLLGDQLPAHTARAESQPCEHRTTRTSAVRAVREARLERGGNGSKGSHLLAMRAATPCLETCARGALSAARAPRGLGSTLSQNGTQHVSARRQIHHPSARPICAPERSADPARPSSAHLVQHGPGVQLAHRACPAHRPPLRRPRVSARAPECGPAAAPRRAGGRVAGPSGGRACRAVASGSERLLHRALRPCSTHPHTRASAAARAPARAPQACGGAGGGDR